MDGEMGWHESARRGEESRGRRGPRRCPDKNAPGEGGGQRGAAPPPRGRMDEPRPACPSRAPPQGLPVGPSGAPAAARDRARGAPPLTFVGGAAGQRGAEAEQREEDGGAGPRVAHRGGGGGGGSQQDPRPRSRGGGAQGRRHLRQRLRAPPGPAPHCSMTSRAAGGAANARGRRARCRGTGMRDRDAGGARRPLLASPLRARQSAERGDGCGSLPGEVGSFDTGTRKAWRSGGMRGRGAAERTRSPGSGWAGRSCQPAAASPRRGVRAVGSAGRGAAPTKLAATGATVCGRAGEGGLLAAGWKSRV